VQKRDAAGKLGFSTFQKMTSAMRMMAYGCSADAVDEYTRMGEPSSPYLSIEEWYDVEIFISQEHLP
jgi:hypothetical protein